MSKIGRNDPCPCGSGEKYKKCHLGKIPEALLLETYSQSDETLEPEEDFELLHYNQANVLIALAALQLEPQNHGKNVRFEELTFKLLKNSKLTDQLLTHKSLSNFFRNNYLQHYLEDPISSFFTENSIFFGGNYRVFPGITHDGTCLFNAFLESIFLHKNNLTTSFKYRVEAGIAWLLTLSELMAYSAGLTRYQDLKTSKREIHVPSEDRLNELMDAVYFDNEFIADLENRIKFPKEFLKEFIITHAELPNSYDPDNFVLNQKPIYELSKGYLFLSPPSVVDSGIRYIKRIAKEENCQDIFLDAFYNWQWNKVIGYVTQIGWQLTSIILPGHGELNIKEHVSQFDKDKLAYVCLVKQKITTENEHSEIRDMAEGEELEEDKYAKRNREVLEYLDEINKGKEFRYFTLYVIGGIGEISYFTWSKPQPGNEVMGISFTDFEKIIFAGDIDQLTLWKFAKAYSKAASKTRMSPFSTILDSYVFYKENHFSLLPTSEATPSLMVIGLGESANFERETIAKRDEHAAKTIHNGKISDVPVIKHKPFAPIYIERELSLQNRLLIESFSFPLWVVNGQATNSRQKRASVEFVEAVSFWLYKMTPSIKEYFNSLNSMPVEVNLILDEKYLTHIKLVEVSDLKSTDILIPVSLQSRVITLEIPYEFSLIIAGSTNEGERLLLKNVLHGFNLLLNNNGLPPIPVSVIDKALDAHMPLGIGKMILFVDSSKDPRLDARGLLGARYIEEAETSFILDNLVEYINSPTPIPKKIATPIEKNALCNRIVSILIDKIEQKLSQFDAKSILEWLMQYNEKYNYDREYKEFQIPARIACFSDFPTEVKKYTTEQAKIMGSVLPVRCLIEFVAAISPSGERHANIDEVDELIALMNEVCQWGIIGDVIHYEMDDPEMGLLPSGRIGMSHKFVNRTMAPLGKSRAENEIHSYTLSFQRRMNIVTDEQPAEYTAGLKEMDEAFSSEFGLTLTQVMYFDRALIQIAMRNKVSVISMEESALIEAIVNEKTDLSHKEVMKGLDILSLGKRDLLRKAPDGFDKNDIYPWKYNRNLSYIRRPLIKLLNPSDNKLYYYWGFRHVFSAAENLRVLMRTGRIKSSPGSLLNSYIAKINDQKGKDYRDLILGWLKENTKLEVIPYEVKINPTGHLQSDKDYGDIDILAIDNRKKVIYSIECKNTVGARVIHEMKTELDKYLGRKGKNGMVQKHVERDKWLKQNKAKLARFVQDPEAYQVISFVLTSDDIPTIYLAKDKLPLPIHAFPVMKRKGWRIVHKK